MVQATKRVTTNGVADDKYVREDWTLFRSVPTISQLSGVPPERLRRLVAKELTDNALDASGNCRVGELEDGGFFVEDDGPGIDGEPEDVARLFSFRRPLISSKVKRLPTRGALGNGHRLSPGPCSLPGAPSAATPRSLAHAITPGIGRDAGRGEAAPLPSPGLASKSAWGGTPSLKTPTSWTGRRPQFSPPERSRSTSARPPPGGTTPTPSSSFSRRLARGLSAMSCRISTVVAGTCRSVPRPARCLTQL